MVNKYLELFGKELYKEDSMMCMIVEERCAVTFFLVIKLTFDLADDETSKHSLLRAEYQ